MDDGLHEGRSTRDGAPGFYVELHCDLGEDKAEAGVFDKADANPGQ